MNYPAPLPPLIQPEKPPALVRQDKKKLALVLGTVALVGGSMLLGQLVTQRQAMLDLEDRPVIVQESSAQGELPKASSELRLPATYADVPIEPRMPAAQPPEAKLVLETNGAENPFLPHHMRPLQPPNPLIPPRQPPAITPSQGSQGAPARTVSTGPPPEKPKPNRWGFGNAQENMIGKPPFAIPQDEQGNQSSLFPKATQERPANPLRVVYRSQVINGILENDINSDIPGPARIRVTEDIQDKFFQGEVLIPQGSIILGQQAAARIEYGQSRVQLSLTAIEQPNGTVIALQQAKAGDISGATGIPGKVNNHYGKLAMSAILSAVLSVGSRGLAGDTRGYNPTVTQEIASDISRSANRTGQDIVKRQLEVPPTITISRSTPVTLQLEQNLNLQSDPVIIQ